MEKKNIDWESLGFGYVKTDYRYVSNYKDGAWDEGKMIDRESKRTAGFYRYENV